jgi:hypothetical protein
MHFEYLPLQHGSSEVMKVMKVSRTTEIKLSQFEDLPLHCSRTSVSSCMQFDNMPYCSRLYRENKRVFTDYFERSRGGACMPTVFSLSHAHSGTSENKLSHSLYSVRACSLRTCHCSRAAVNSCMQFENLPLNCSRAAVSSCMQFDNMLYCSGLNHANKCTFTDYFELVEVTRCMHAYILSFCFRMHPVGLQKILVSFFIR